LLGDQYIISLVNGHGRWSAAYALLNYARWSYRIARGLKTEGRPQSCGSGKYLITSIDLRPNLTGMILPVIDLLGHDNCIVIGQPAVQPLLPKSVEFLSWESLPAIDMGEWRRAYLPCVPSWLRTLNAFRSSQRLPHGFVPEMLDATAVQTQKILRYERLLDRFRPAAILTEFDRNNLVAPMIFAARTRGVPTVTMVHGVANSLYAPLLADIVCCWGHLDRAMFIRAGVNPERIAVTGYTRMQRQILAIDPGRKRMIAASTASHIVLFATSPINVDTKLKLARDFCEAVFQLPDTAALIRLHPSERVSEYAEVSYDFPAVRFLANDGCTLDEAVAIADVVVVQNSGFGNDALMKGRAVVVLNSVPGDWPVTEELISLAGCPTARTSSKLSALLITLVSDIAARAAVVERAEQYIRTRCAFFGCESAKRVAEVVRSSAAGGSHD
jgi:hypothetical protein